LPEALTSAKMFRAFAKTLRGAPLLAKMEFGRAPLFTAAEFEVVGCRMVI
jgi:methylisocitrate lyase